jgi:hypothetical protein
MTTDDSISFIREVYHEYRMSLRRYRKPGSFMPVLVEALRVLPGDDWLTSLRVDYRPPGFPSLASREGHATCQATRWWCDLLFIQLNARDSVALADSMLQTARIRMPAHVRCIWGDVSILIADGALRKRYEEMSCDQRAEFEERFWWLTDPHHSIAGNERRTDHVARSVLLRRSTETGFATLNGWGWGLIMINRAEHVFRGTDPKSSEQPGAATAADSVAPGMRGPTVLIRRAKEEIHRSSPMGSGGINGTLARAERMVLARPIVSYRRSVPLQFVPGAGALADPFHAEPSDWTLDAPKPRETGYATVPGSYTPLDRQHAYFLRGDSARLVVVSVVPRGSALDRGILRAALAVSRAPDDPPRVLRTPGGPRFGLTMTVPIDSHLVSLEVFSLGANWGRARFGAVPPTLTGQRVRLSDVALFDPQSVERATPIGLESVVERMHGTSRYAATSIVGLFWELYGLRDGEQAALSVNAVREPSDGIVRSALGLFIGRAAPDSALRVAWTDLPAAGRGIEPRTIALGLATLEPGRYVLTLRAEVPGEPPAVVHRRIEIVKK